MPNATAARPKIGGVRRVTKKATMRGIKAVPGSPLAGLEHLIGCVTSPRARRSRQAILRARYLADHNT